MGFSPLLELVPDLTLSAVLIVPLSAFKPPTAPVSISVRFNPAMYAAPFATKSALKASALAYSQPVAVLLHLLHHLGVALILIQVNHDILDTPSMLLCAHASQKISQFPALLPDSSIHSGQIYKK